MWTSLLRFILLAPVVLGTTLASPLAGAPSYDTNIIFPRHDAGDDDGGSFSLVTPPGLPTLSSLNLTMSDLEAPEVTNTTAVATDTNSPKSQDLPDCQTKDLAFRTAIDKCMMYLQKLPKHQSCVTGHTFSRMCSVNQMDKEGKVIKVHQIWGYTKHDDRQQSYCSDVLKTVEQIVSYCGGASKEGSSYLAGRNEVNGNGDFVVVVDSAVPGDD
ncbi:hypothetical protein MKZ38_001076 [Zalerion maritima]|uniref:Secreted protein n=1 Tax=Zalerion maritima TaxID=339359 RepID=A0AAD5RSC0_9PEZI|nr:hypothetical protein MKZ38_001076 [Zalerion maritima]